MTRTREILKLLRHKKDLDEANMTRPKHSTTNKGTEISKARTLYEFYLQGKNNQWIQ